MNKIFILVTISYAIRSVISCATCRQIVSHSVNARFRPVIIQVDADSDSEWYDNQTGKSGINEYFTIFRKENVNELNSSSEEDGKWESDDVVEDDENMLSTSMVASIGIYKNFISPLLPPACRFAPTCSQYGVQAIKEYGPTKGFILTGWRILRCSPFGGKGYDPPSWPPCSYWGTGATQ